MRVLCLLDEVLRENPADGADRAELRARLGLDNRTIQKLRKNTSDWRLDAKAFTRLMLYGFENGLPNGIFAIRPHPIWRTFVRPPGQPDRTAFIYRAPKGPDSKVEGDLSAFLQGVGCDSTTKISDPANAVDIDEIRNEMRSHNCIFIGSPKSNAASEAALCLLWNAKPFQKGPQLQDKLPFHMLMPDAEAHGASSIIAPGGRQHGFSVDDGKRRNITVTRKPQSEYEKGKVEGQDAAMIAIARSPLGTTEEVTTIVIAGYTSLSTRVAASQLRIGEPPLTEEAMSTAGRHLLAYAFDFHKPKRTSGSPPREGKEVPKTGKWAPPWSKVSD